jgi:hypothetical protein
VCAIGVVGAATALDALWWRPRGQDLAAGSGYMIAVVLVSSKSELHHLAFAMPGIGLGVSWLWTLEARSSRWATAIFVAAVVGIAASKLAGPAQGLVLCVSLMMLAAGLAGISPSSASRKEIRSCTGFDRSPRCCTRQSH